MSRNAETATFNAELQEIIQTTFATGDDGEGTPIENRDRTGTSVSVDETDVTEAEPTEETQLSPGVVWGVLSDQHRRYVLYYLKRCGAPATVDELIEQVAVWETETEATAIPTSVYEQTEIELVGSHLPTLANSGLIDYDEPEGVVALTESSDVFAECLRRAAHLDD